MKLLDIAKFYVFIGFITKKLNINENYPSSSSPRLVLVVNYKKKLAYLLSAGFI